MKGELSGGMRQVFHTAIAYAGKHGADAHDRHCRHAHAGVRWTTDMPRKKAVPRNPPIEIRYLVQRKCRLCEWEGEQVELPGADPDCPWCHGPTEAVRMLQLPRGIIVSGVSQAKNPFAAALGRLGAKKGGVARARALSPKRRREIARKAARARWSKAGRKR
jgi:hypothetical protein